MLPAELTLLRRSTRGQNDNAVAAGLYKIGAGRLVAPPAASHRISIHLGAPVWASCSLGGPVRRRLQTQGDIDLIPAGQTGVWEDEAAATVLLVEIPLSHLADAARSAGLGEGHLMLEPQTQIRDASVEMIGRAVRAEIEAGQPSGPLYLDALGLALSARLVARFGMGRAATPARAALAPARLRRVLDYIECNLGQDLSLAHLAHVAAMSASQFKWAFRQTLGVPAHQYVMRLRTVRAEELLREGRLALSEIAAATGFADQSHMARWLRRERGLSPSALRRAGHFPSDPPPDRPSIRETAGRDS